MTFQLFSKGRRVSDQVFIESFASHETLGIFESLRTYNGKIFRLEEHLKRFQESARTTGLQEEIKPQEIRRELTAALKNFQRQSAAKECFLRVTWWPAGIFVMIGERNHPAQLYKEGIALQSSPVKRSLTHAIPAGAKTTDYMNAIMATLEPKPEQVYEWIFLDRFGLITEVRIGNIFLIKNGELFTPPVLGILNGVTRRFVIECAEVLGIPLHEMPLTRHEVFNAEEVFLTNTSWEILPVRELDGRKTGMKIPGPLTQTLQTTFKQKALRECR